MSILTRPSVKIPNPYVGKKIYSSTDGKLLYEIIDAEEIMAYNDLMTVATVRKVSCMSPLSSTTLMFISGVNMLDKRNIDTINAINSFYVIR